MQAPFSWYPRLVPVAKRTNLRFCRMPSHRFFQPKLTTETSKGDQPTWPVSPFFPSSSREDVVKLSKSSDSYFPACLLLMICQVLKLNFLHSPIFLSKLEKVRSLLGTEGSCFRNDYSSAVVAGGYHNRQVMVC